MTDEERTLIGFIIDEISRYMAEAGISEEDHTLIRAVAEDIATMVGSVLRHCGSELQPPQREVEIVDKHRTALEHEKAFWTKIVSQDTFQSMQDNWRRTGEHFESIAGKYLALDHTSKILQIGAAAQGAISFWKMGRRIALDPLADFYRRSFNQSDEGITHVKGLGEKLPFSDSSIDVVLCLNVLDHTMSPELVVSEMSRVLRDGGLLFLGVDVYPKDLLDEGKRDPIHLWRFTSSDISQLVAKPDFLIKEETLCEESAMEGARWFWVLAMKGHIEDE